MEKAIKSLFGLDSGLIQCFQSIGNVGRHQARAWLPHVPRLFDVQETLSFGERENQVGPTRGSDLVAQ